MAIREYRPPEGSRLTDLSADLAVRLDLIEAAAVSVTIGPFITAISTELGRRSGSALADWFSKIRVRIKRGHPAQAELVVDLDKAVTVLELDEGGLPDEAWVALIDLDMKDDGVRGHRLKWDGQAGAWVSADKIG